jgi:acyl-coenzyme A thioesterase PaaI-like protein
LKDITIKLRTGSSAAARIEVVAATSCRVECHIPFAADQLRQGGLVNGPTQMMLADAAAYALVLASEPEALMAVTGSLSMQFLQPAPAASLSAQATLIDRSGRRVTCDVRLSAADARHVVSQAVNVYVLSA